MGMTQTNFAKSLGLHRGHISNIERGNVPVSDKVIDLICQGWDIREEWLREGKGEMSSVPLVTYPENLEFDLWLEQSQCVFFSKFMNSDAVIIKNLKERLAEDIEKNTRSLKPMPELMAAKKKLEAALEEYLSMIQEAFNPKSMAEWIEQDRVYNEERDFETLEKLGLKINENQGKEED